MNYEQIQEATEIEADTARLWNDAGTIQIIEFGNENTYYINEFGHTFYCKNYPKLYGKIRNGWTNNEETI